MLFRLWVCRYSQRTCRAGWCACVRVGAAQCWGSQKTDKIPLEKNTVKGSKYSCVCCETESQLQKCRINFEYDTQLGGFGA